MINLDAEVTPELRSWLLSAIHWSIDEIKNIPDLRSWLLQVKPLPEIAHLLEAIDVYDIAIESCFGDSLVHLRIYRPKDLSEMPPCVVFFRGSGFIIGHIRQFDPFLCELGLKTNSIIISCDYRLAPEHPFPSALEDCYSTLVWVASEKCNLDIDQKRIALMGVSAGGGLALSVALMARDLGGPEIRILLPLYPMIDCSNSKKSLRSVIDDRVWDGKKNQKAWHAYLGVHPQKLNYQKSALLAESFKGLPPVFSYIGELDALLDETLEMVNRLSEDEVPCEFHRFRGCFHSFETSVPEAEISKYAKGLIVSSLVRAFEIY